MSSNKLIQDAQVEKFDRRRIESLVKNQPVDDKTAKQKATPIDFSKVLVIITTICLLLMLSTAIIGSYIFSSIKLDAITSHLNMEQNKPSTYERLGHSECPDTPGTSTIYTGFIVGFSTTTGATTFQCLPTEKGSVKYYNDTFSRYTGSGAEIRYLNLTEYQTFRPGKTNFDATCALCSVRVRNVIQMIPATYECPETWTREYYGYLMTGYFSTTFVCVDINMEGFQNSADAAPNHPTLHHVTAHYKIAHSDEYLDGKVLSCAVCSK